MTPQRYARRACVDCWWSRGLHDPYCEHWELRHRPSTDQRQVLACDTARSDENLCGRQGIHFLPPDALDTG